MKGDQLEDLAVGGRIMLILIF